MASQDKVFFGPKFAETAVTTQYTSTDVVSRVDKLTASNTGGVAATLAVHVLPPGVAASNATLVMPAVTLLAGGTYECPEVVGHRLEKGYALATVASQPNMITIMSSGVQIT